jgi:cullin-associated NEDD8-dissociated protein 1
LILSGIDKLIEPLRTTIQSKAKANSVKQEFEKQDELKRSAMRAIAALLTIPDSGRWKLIPKFNIKFCIYMAAFILCTFLLALSLSV